MYEPDFNNLLGLFGDPLENIPGNNLDSTSPFPYKSFDYPADVSTGNIYPTDTYPTDIYSGDVFYEDVHTWQRSEQDLVNRLNYNDFFHDQELQQDKQIFNPVDNPFFPISDTISERSSSRSFTASPPTVSPSISSSISKHSPDHSTKSIPHVPSERTSNSPKRKSRNRSHIKKSASFSSPEFPDGKTQLDNLIDIVEKHIKSKSTFLSKVKDTKALLESLKDLNKIIGMKKLKNSIGMQTMKIIDSINKGNNRMGMLNMVLYGSPGVGKTMVAIKLAKIWQALGFLEKNVGVTENVLDKALNLSANDLIFFVSVFLLSFQVLLTFHSILGTKWTIILTILAAVIVLSLYLYKKRRDAKKDITEDEKNRQIVKVVNRADLVDKYLGGTVHKTKKLCDENKGKVLFFDEAYSLITDDMDPYGKEALDTLNLYMSENPDNFVVIFAGYKHMLQETIFTAQPGLPSRCMWHLECDEYSGEDLSLIFLQQLDEKKIEYDESIIEDIKELIIDNTELFPGSGRDTKRLVNYIESIVATKNFGNEGDSKMTVEDIEKGLDTLKENNILKDNTGTSSGRGNLRNIFNKIITKEKM